MDIYLQQVKILYDTNEYTTNLGLVWDLSYHQGRVFTTREHGSWRSKIRGPTNIKRLHFYDGFIQHWLKEVR